MFTVIFTTVYVVVFIYIFTYLYTYIYIDISIYIYIYIHIYIHIYVYLRYFGIHVRWYYIYIHKFVGTCAIPPLDWPCFGEIELGVNQLIEWGIRLSGTSIHTYQHILRWPKYIADWVWGLLNFDFVINREWIKGIKKNWRRSCHRKMWMCLLKETVLRQSAAE